MSHLKGPKPTDQWRSGQSLSFIINLKTAKAHGLSPTFSTGVKK